MKTKKSLTARKYTSPLLQDVLGMLTEVEKEQSRLRLTIAARIDDYRKASGLSKRNLADRLNQKPSVMTKWMSGTHNFTSDTLVEIAIALGVDVKALQTYYGEEVGSMQSIQIKTMEMEPVVLLLTPTRERASKDGFKVKLSSDLTLNSCSPYVA